MNNSNFLDCVICGAMLPDLGHNPDPISKTGRCCSSCNSLVIVARIKQLTGNEKKVW